MARRSFTSKQEAKIVAYYKEHGHTKTLNQFKIVSSVLHRMIKAASTKPAPAASHAAKANGLEAVAYLRQAWRLIEKDIKAGGEVHDSYLYVKLALNQLGGPRK